MVTPLAKITAPLPAEIVERARLHRALDEAFQRSVTWVGGPGGCGKTTLIASYVNARRCRCLWYQVDAGDADPGSVFHFLSLACKQLDPAARNDPLPVFGPELLSGLTVFARRFFRDLFLRLAAPFVLVFDNLNEAPPDSALYGILREGICEIPRAGHMVFLSRSEPHPLMARFLATREMSHLTWDNLRFSEAEVKALVELLEKRKPEQQEISRIMTLTQGWVAGLLLLTSRRGAGGTEERYHPIEVGNPLFDYFAVEVCDRIDASRQDFLLRTAFLPKISSGVARDLTGDPDAERILNELARRNFFTVRRPPGDIYEYHPLFRAFLQQRAAVAYTPDELIGAKRAAALSLARDAQVGEAASLLIEILDWDELARLVEHHAPAMLGQSRHRTVESWLVRVPGAVLNQNPWLHYWLGVARAPFNPAQALASLTHAYEHFKGGKDTSGALLSWAAIVELLTNFNVYGPQLDTWLDEFENLASSHLTYPSKEIECRVAASMHAGLEYARPWHLKLRHWADRALTLAEELGHTEVLLRTYYNRLLTLSFFPAGPERSIVLDRVRHLCGRPEISTLDRIRAMFAFEARALYDGRLQEAVTIGTKALDTAEQDGIAAFTPLILYMLGSAYQAAEDPENSSRVLAQLADLVTAHGEIGSLYYFALKAAEEYLKGNVREAQVAARAAAGPLGSSRLTYAHTVIGILATHIYSDAGAPDEAAAQLAPLRDFGEKTDNRLLLHNCHLCEAEIALNRGDRDQAVRALREAMAFGKEVDVSFAYTWRPSTLAKLCVLALEHGIEPETVQRIVRARKLRPDVPPVHLDTWPWPLRIYTLGEFEIEKGGTPLVLPDKAYRKPLELLKALIALGGPRGVAAQRVQDALWPDAEGDAAEHSFEVTLSRLRKAIDLPGAIELREGMLSLSPHLCWVDAWALKEFVKQAGAKLNEPQRTPAPAEIEALERELWSRYRGAFLENLSGAGWADDAKEKLASSIARVLYDLGLHWERHGQPERARGCCEKGLQIERISAQLRDSLSRTLGRLG